MAGIPYGMISFLKQNEKLFTRKTKPTFDPEGSGYDEEIGAELSALNPLTIPKPKKYQGEVVKDEDSFQSWIWHPELNDYKKHSGSRDFRTGQMLKGKKHKTWDLAMQGEDEAGYQVFKGVDGKYYSQKRNE